MSYSCTTQPERLPIVTGEDCLITNRGTDEIILGQSPSSLIAYGTAIPPGSSVLYDLSKERWIAACSGTQKYDILRGGKSALPSSTEIATQILNSDLSTQIGDKTSGAILSSNLSGQIADDILRRGTRVIDVPTLSTWGPIDHYPYTFKGVNILDLTDAQSIAISWRWEVLSASNLASFGELTVSWWSDLYGQVPFGVDVYEIAAPNINTPGTLGKSESAVIHLPVKAPGMSLAFKGIPDPGASGRALASGYTLKSYRLTPRETWASDNASDRILGFANKTGLAGGGTASIYFPFSPYDGLIEIHGWCSGTATTNTHMRFGYGSESFTRHIGGGSPPMEDVLFFPVGGLGAWTSRQVSGSSRRPIYVQFFNAEAGAKDFSAWITCDTFA